MDKLTILFLAANPIDTVQLALDEEMRAIDLELRKTEHRDRFDLRSAWAVRSGDLQELLLRYQPHIVHFSGHGSSTGELILKAEDGRSQIVPAGALTGLFDLLKDNIRCVVLNACWSEAQAQGIAKAIDCVVGMTQEVTDTAATQFAAGFYLGLGYGRSVQQAFDLGCNRIQLAGGSENTTPKLIALRTRAAEIKLVGAALTSPSPSAQASSPGAPGPAAITSSKPLNLPTKLTGQQFGKVQDAIANAFSPEELQQVFFTIFGKQLYQVAGGSTHQAVVFNTLGWAERTGNLPTLLEGLLNARKDKPEFQATIAGLL